MKFSLRQQCINRDGYDRNGAYYGVGGRVFHAIAEEPDDFGEFPEYFFRVKDRVHAKAYVRNLHPNARFYR